MSDEDGPASIEDGADFNNSDAWGFCEYCAFEVAVTIPEGIKVKHRAVRNGGDDATCNGSGSPAVLPTPLEAKARPRVVMRKDMQRARTRQFWQKRRSEARERAREEASEQRTKLLTPTRITVTSSATGEEVDLTPYVTGPVTLNLEADC